MLLNKFKIKKKISINTNDYKLYYDYKGKNHI